jgi:hypothetical protein
MGSLPKLSHRLRLGSRRFPTKQPYPKKNGMHNKASHHNLLTAPSRILWGRFNPHPESLPRPR